MGTKDSKYNTGSGVIHLGADSAGNSIDDTVNGASPQTPAEPPVPANREYSNVILYIDSKPGDDERVVKLGKALQQYTERTFMHINDLSAGMGNLQVGALGVHFLDTNTYPALVIIHDMVRYRREGNTVLSQSGDEVKDYILRRWGYDPRRIYRVQPGDTLSNIVANAMQVFGLDPNTIKKRDVTNPRATRPVPVPRTSKPQTPPAEEDEAGNKEKKPWYKRDLFGRDD